MSDPNAIDLPKSEREVIDSIAAPASPPSIAEQPMSVALMEYVGLSLLPIVTGAGLLYLFFGISHYFVLEPPARLPMSVTALLSATGLLLIALYLRLRSAQIKRAHLWAGLTAGIVLLNCWLHLVLTGDSLQSSNFMLLILGTGVFFLSSRWYTSFLLFTVLSWVGAHYWFLGFTNETVHFAFGLFSASILATLAHYARKQRLIRLVSLREQDQQRARELQSALESIKATEASYRQLSRQLEERTEALQTTNQALASASKLKDEFLASMSHELRTPLTAILGLTESLKENIYGPVSERQTQALANVLESGRHLLDLINDVLDVAKTEAGKLELDVVPADLRMVAEASVRFVQPSAEAKEIELDITADPAVKLVLADERRLKQILINLLSNAVKFTRQGGQVGLRLVGDAEHQIVRYTVWDTGIGISEEQMSQLFKPFIQLDSRLARQYGGTGLGLVLAYRMAEMHGGSITVSSQPEQGSEFTIHLPWRKADLRLQEEAAAAATEPANAAPANGGAAGTLLIVDDHSLSRNWLKSVAQNNGYAAVATTIVSDLPELITTTAPDLLLIDMQMPPNDSYILIQTLCSGTANTPPVRAPIIAVSALGLPGEMERAKAAGAAAYLVKPVSSVALHNTIAHLATAQQSTGWRRE